MNTKSPFEPQRLRARGSRGEAPRNREPVNAASRCILRKKEEEIRRLHSVGAEFGRKRKKGRAEGVRGEKITVKASLAESKKRVELGSRAAGCPRLGYGIYM